MKRASLNANRSRNRLPNIESQSKGDVPIRFLARRWLFECCAGSISHCQLPLPLAINRIAYVKELAFVDWAREAICRGEDILKCRCLHRFGTSVSKRQRGFAEKFAKAWRLVSVGSTSIGVIGVEHVLEHVVAKVAAKKNRVLLIVLDGMSWAVCHELLEDIRQDHWFESTFDEESAIPNPVIAAIPARPDTPAPACCQAS